MEGNNYKVLIEGMKVANIKYRKGWLYFVNLNNWFLYRMPLEGGEPELFIEETIDNYYLTDETIVYQTGYITPMGILREKYGSKKYYFKELNANGETEILMEEDIEDHKYYYSFNYCIVQLIHFDDTGLYYAFFNEKERSTYLFKYADSKQTKLSDYLIDNEVFPAIMLDDYIYAFCYIDNVAGSEGFIRIKKDGSKEEKIGGFYSTPNYLLPG